MTWWTNRPTQTPTTVTGWWALLSEAFSLGVTPSLGMQTVELVDLAVSPALGMAATGLSHGSFGLSVSPAVSVSAPGYAVSSLALTPAVGMAGAGIMPASFGLSVTPAIGEIGADRQVGSFSVPVSPSMGFAGVGTSGATNVAFDSAGTGTNTASASPSWSHTVGSSATAVVIAYVGTSNTAMASTTRTATFGGVSMTSVAAVQNYGTSGTFQWVELFALLNPPTGTRTAQVNLTGTISSFSGVSFAYTGVGSLGTGVTAHATTTSLSQTVSAAVNDMVVQAFVGVGASTTISSYNQTQRWIEGASGGHVAMVAGDAPGAASVSFTATASASGGWGSVALPLVP